MENLKNRIAAILHRCGLSANFVTYCGFFIALLSGCLVYQGRFFLAGLFLLLSGFLDLMDGALARISGKTSLFGGILDSSLDRYGDGFVMGGILLFFFTQQNTFYAVLALSALLGSFSISYVRARAECVMEKCKVGFWERGERIVFIALGLLLNNLEAVLWVLAIGTHATAFFRLYYASHYPKVPSFDKIFFHTGSRVQTSYAVKAVLLFLVLLLLRDIKKY